MRNAIGVMCLVVLVAGLASIASALEIETVAVGNPGNANDTHGDGFGSVGYAYRIGKYEVSNAEYCEFLNAKAALGDPHALYNLNMASGWNDTGGILKSGSGTAGDPWVYSPRTNRANRPVNYVSFWDACRFTNWLHNGQGAADTENGAYTLTTDGVANNTVTRNANWKWAVTSLDEWYKAAYYDGDSAVYYNYPTGSDTPPTAELPSGTDLTNGSANYHSGGFTDTTWYTTERGAYNAKPSDSPYGTFDQGGNLWEWNESVSGNFRGLRGGSLGDVVNYLHPGSHLNTSPASESQLIGFRVAEIPEPATMAILMLGGIGILRKRKRLQE